MKWKIVIFALTLLAIAATVGCGTSGSVVLPPTGGNYSNASLKGSYVYQVHGFDPTGNPFRQIGVFTADGNRNITGGTDDSSANASAMTVSGTYNVAKDGTGIITINTSLGTVTWAITLASTSRLQLIEADGFANAGGTAELQDPTALTTIPSGTLVFRLHQENSAENQAPAGEVGALAFSNGAGTGSMDQNLAGTLTSPNVSSTLSAPAGDGRGTGTLLNGSTNFTTNFVYYIVNSSKLYLLVTNFGAVGSGSAELQSGAVGNGLSGSYAFGSRGEDGNFFAGIATVGQFSASSGVMSGIEDISQDGNVSNNVTISSCYSASANGRVVVTSSSGGCTSTVTQVFWMVSPSRAFFVNAASNTVEDGAADLQTMQNFAASTFAQQYSIAMDGIDVTPQLLSRVGALQFDGKGSAKLNEVANASSSGAGANNPGILAGNYTVGSNGRIAGTFGGGSLDLVMYAVSASQAYVLQNNSGTTTSGQILLQQ